MSTMSDYLWRNNLCCICFEFLTPETCAVDMKGVKWDTCKGKCAEEAGIQEKREET